MTIDLRSDTVTKPTPGMLEAMFSASVGDDVFQEDPTVKKLENKAASMFGKEAGLFCPSGTMTNQLAIKTHTRPGDEVICDITSHIYNYENGGIALNSGCSVNLLNGDRGRISAGQVKNAIKPQLDWLPRSTLASIENTCNKAGGSYYSLDQVKSIADVCRENGLKFHLDGARIFNALIESGESASDWGSHFNSISICLSKGLGAPIGSLLLGSNEFIKEARRFRKAFGGGMRQVGYMAAAGVYALDNHVDRLKEDHQRARAIGDILKDQSYVKELYPVETNIVIFRLIDSLRDEVFIQKLMEKDIKVIAMGPQAIRLVTHLDFNDEMLDAVITCLKRIG